MSQPYIPENAPVLREVLGAYPFPDTLLGAVRYGQGHINETYCVLCQPREGECIRYILQAISRAAFPEPEKLMENFVAITSYLRRQITALGGNPDRETLGLVHTRDGKPFYTDGQGKVWRLVPLIEGTQCCQQATPELFEATGRAFGRFQYMLRDYPAQTLHETIRDFHNTEVRYDNFIRAVERDSMGRAESVREEIRFVTERKADCSVTLQALREGILPLRVTHNDAKLNNILIDPQTGEGICVIDLDTTMPGLSVNDFGDSVRFGANHCAEDEKDLGKVNFDLNLYEVFTRGFIQGAQGGLTPAELEYLPWGARLMTLECGIRFLTDYLEGDRYFHIAYPEQNLDRTRTQFKLVWDMEQKFDEMKVIVDKYTR